VTTREASFAILKTVTSVALTRALGGTDVRSVPESTNGGKLEWGAASPARTSP
jgi:hypothetical protein